MTSNVYGAEFIKKRRTRRSRVKGSQWTWKPHDPVVASKIGIADFRYPHALYTNYTPSNKRQKIVLAFDMGAMSEGLVYWLKRYKMKFFHIDYEQFIANQGKLTLSNSEDSGSALLFGPARLQLDDVAAVLWSPPDIRIFQASRSVEYANVFLSRWQQVLRELGGVLRRAVWLPGPPMIGAQEYQNKFSEYLYAQDLGLRVPDCVFTNEPAIARAFMAKWKGQVLFRDFSKLQGLFKIGFASSDLSHLPKAPCIFQQYVEKEYEIRAVVVGEKVFACRINSQDSARTRLDWRGGEALVKWDRIELPKTLQRRLVALVRRLGLTFSSIDLVKSTDGRHYFLEANRPGACYWLKPYAGLDIAKEMVKFARGMV